MDASAKLIRVGLLGCGNVGKALAKLLSSEAAGIEQRTGFRFVVTAIAVRDTSIDRGVDSALLTDNPQSIVESPDVDVVVELIGGLDPARSLIESALRAGKSVVTGNKELIAAAGSELEALAAESNSLLLYEAAVGGGIPIIRPLRESLAGEPIRSVMGIVNGTTNYILSRMTEEGADYADVLSDAQVLGFAEADPTADVEAFDAAAKARIIADVAFGATTTAEDVHREGISSITADDIDLAGRLGFVVKLLAIVQKNDDGRVGVRVHPTMIPGDHPLASVRLSFNAVFVQGDSVGDLMFYGRGAGGEPTASAVLGDLIDAASHTVAPTRVAVAKQSTVELWPIEEQSSAFYLTLDVADKPGVLSIVAGLFGKHEISIRSMEQLGLADEAKLVFITHVAEEQAMKKCLEELAALDAVREVGNVIRVLEA